MMRMESGHREAIPAMCGSLREAIRGCTAQQLQHLMPGRLRRSDEIDSQAVQAFAPACCHCMCSFKYAGDDHSREPTTRDCMLLLVCSNPGRQPVV